MPHGDYTGNQKNILAARFAEERQLAASSMAMVTQVVAEQSDKPIDLMPVYEDRKPRELHDDEYGDVIEVDSDDPSGLWEPKKFRASDSVDGITIGKDTIYNLQEGQTYTVPSWVYDHLDEKNLVWH